MTLPHLTPTYEKWAPVIARVLFGLIFLSGAAFKIPGTENFDMQVGFATGAGIPLPMIAVLLAFLLEVFAGVALIIGFHTRTAAAALIAFVVLIIFFFYRNPGDPAQFPLFMSSLQLIAGLLYVSVYGAQNMAFKLCQLPKGLTISMK